MFRNCKTLEDLKKEYHRLALKHHPDAGGDTAKMQEVNNSYDKAFASLKHLHRNAKGEIYEKDTDETPEAFRDIIAELLKCAGVTIEIIGSFVWVHGDTKPHKDKLKAMGFRWHTKKMCWYKSPEGYRRRGKAEYTLEDIRLMYGSKAYKGEGLQQLPA